MSFENLSVVTRGGIHTVTVKRPAKLNALNGQNAGIISQPTASVISLCASKRSTKCQFSKWLSK